MIEISLKVDKARVYNEVAQTTGYTGAKMTGEENEDAYDRILTTDEDASQLERFWVETCNTATEKFKPFLLSVSGRDEDSYEVELELSSAFDVNLRDSIESSLFSFFVTSIVSKWFKIANKGESDSAVADAVGMMEDVLRKIYYRKKPKRVEPVD